MTDEQRQKIKTLLYQGFGYKEVAKATGLSRDTISGYCKRNGLHGFASELATEYKKIMKESSYLLFVLITVKNLSRIA